MKNTRIVQAKSALDKPPSHPGKILVDDFMSPEFLTCNKLALALAVAPQRIQEIVNGKRAISAETALRLARYFGTSSKYWLDLQSAYDLSLAKEKWAEVIEKTVRPLKPIANARQNKEPRNRQAGKQNRTLTKLPKDQKKLYELIQDEYVHVDFLCTQSGMPVGHVAAALTMLELADLVRRFPGDRYKRTVSNISSSF